MIKFEDVTKKYGSTTALDQISFEIDDEFVVVAGKSGAGKTTLLEMILAKETPTSGRVVFDGEVVNELQGNEVSDLRQRIGAIFQDYKLLSDRTAFENIGYAMRVVGASEEDIEKRVPQVLDIVSMKEFADSYPRELSEGEQQRVAIARALATKPEVVLADEPTGNLDPYYTQDIIQLLKKIYEMGATVILATHDRQTVNSLEQRVISLKDGRLVNDQDPGKFVL
ncbi:MAG: ATP-binding cassette domain-containing protein [Candidatus Paceibacterota bacterium]